MDFLGGGVIVCCWRTSLGTNLMLWAKLRLRILWLLVEVTYTGRVHSWHSLLHIFEAFAISSILSNVY